MSQILPVSELKVDGWVLLLLEPRSLLSLIDDNELDEWDWIVIVTPNVAGAELSPWVATTAIGCCYRGWIEIELEWNATMKGYNVIGKENKMYDRIFSLAFNKQRGLCRHCGQTIGHSIDTIVSSGNNLRKYYHLHCEWQIKKLTKVWSLALPNCLHY